MNRNVTHRHSIGFLLGLALGVIGVWRVKAAARLSREDESVVLEQLPVGSAQGQPAISERDRERDAWHGSLVEMAKQLPLLGLVAFVALRYLYTRFYMEFGLVPEDVGFTYIAILAKSGLLLLVLAAVALL